MIPLTRFSLARLRHVDLLALAIEAGIAPESIPLRAAARSKDQIAADLSRTGPMARLAERAERRLVP